MYNLWRHFIIYYNRRPMKKISGTERSIKDLMFLRALPSQQVGQGIIKRVEVQGTGQTIGDIKVPCSVYLSMYKYDYEGRFHSQVLNACIRDMNKKSPEIPSGVYTVVETMKAEEKAWVNFRLPYLHEVPGLPHSGCHFYITIEDIKYKNSDTLESKRIVSEKCREEAKKLFMAKDYEKALKFYRKEINITEGIERKKFSKEDLEQMGKINERAKRNMLKCFAKLTNVDDNLSQLAEKSSKQLMKKYNDNLTILLRCHVLKQRKYLTTALEMAQELLKKGQKDAAPLVEELKQLIKNKK